MPTPSIDLIMASNTDDVAMNVMIKTEDSTVGVVGDPLSAMTGETSGYLGSGDQEGEIPGDDFNAFHDLIQASDPMLLWSLVRAKVVPHISIWEFMGDKARNSEPEEDGDDDGDPKDADYQARKLQTHRLKVMLEQLGEVVTEMGKMVQNCCIDADTPDPPKRPPKRRRTDQDDQELVMSVNKTMNRVLHNKIPNASGNGFKLKRDIPEQYSDIFHVEVPEEEIEDDGEDINTPVEGGKHNCHYCDLAYKSLYTLRKHIKTHAPAACTQCKEEFHFDPMSKLNPSERLAQHFKNSSTCSDTAAEPKPRKFEAVSCDECEKSFAKLSALKAHKQLHKPTHCDVCKTDFYHDVKSKPTKQAQFLAHRRKCLEKTKSDSKGNPGDATKCESCGGEYKSRSGL